MTRALFQTTLRFFALVALVAVLGGCNDTTAPGSSVASKNLVADSGFEHGTAGFTVANAGDSAFQTTVRPVAGQASLHVDFNSAGGTLSWHSPEIGRAASSAAYVGVTGRVRIDSIAAQGLLKVCVDVVYSGASTPVETCSAIAATEGVVGDFAVGGPLDGAKTLGSIGLRVVLTAGASASFDLDEVSVALASTAPVVVPVPAPSSAPSTTVAATPVAAQVPKPKPKPAPAPVRNPAPVPAPVPVPVPVPVPAPGSLPPLSATTTTSNLTTNSGSVIPVKSVTVTSAGLFQLVFEEADNWGIAQWYDLVNDPGMQTNLTGPGIGSACPMCAEPGLFQEVFYGSNPEDVKLFTRAVYFFPNTPRSMAISENTPSRVVITTTSQPMVNEQGVDTNITVSVTYRIYPDGKIYVQSKISMAEAETIREWRMAVLGLEDPTANNRNGSVSPDTEGWIRASATQNPFKWVDGYESYIYAYWSQHTPAPNTHWTRASVLLVPSPDNSNAGQQGVHGWPSSLTTPSCHAPTCGWKRWFFGHVPLTLPAGGSLTQQYLIQLGTSGSSVLPNLRTDAVAAPIANRYIRNPTPP